MKSKLSKYLIGFGLAAAIYSAYPTFARADDGDFKTNIFDLTLKQYTREKELDQKTREFIEKCRKGFTDARNAGEYSKATHFYLEPAIESVKDLNKANSICERLNKIEQKENERQSELERKLQIDSEFEKISLSLDDALKIYNNFDISKINPADYGLKTRGKEKELADLSLRSFRYSALMLYYSNKLGVDEKTVFRTGTAENRFYDNDGDAGEKGPFQILPSTGKWLEKKYGHLFPCPGRGYAYGPNNVFCGILYLSLVKKQDLKSTYLSYNGSIDLPSGHPKKDFAVTNLEYCEKFDSTLPLLKKFVINRLEKNSNNNIAKEMEIESVIKK